jgi:hypothetical protein
MSMPPPSYPSDPPSEPPSYPPQGPPPPGAQTFYYQPLEGRLQALKIVFYLIAGISVLAAFSDVLEILLLNQLIAGEDVSDARIDANDIRQGLAGSVQTLALVGGAIAFILWLHRAYQNTDAVAPGVRRYGHGWAIGAWFVPFLNLWRPKQIVNDLWNAGGDGREPSGVVQAWWALWILTNFVANIATRAAFSGDTNEDIRGGSYAYLVSDLLDAAAAILAIAVATKITERLNAQAAKGPPSGSPASVQH